MPLLNYLRMHNVEWRQDAEYLVVLVRAMHTQIVRCEQHVFTRRWFILAVVVIIVIQQQVNDIL